MVILKKDSHMLETMCKVTFLKFFLAFLALSRIKWFKFGLFGTKHGTHYNLLYVIVLKWLESKTIDISLKLHAKLHF